MNTELPSFAVRDPFKHPVAMLLTPEGKLEMDRAVRALLPERQFSDTCSLVFAMRTTLPKTVLDARGWYCDVCGRGVWLAPSSARVLDRCVVCIECLMSELDLGALSDTLLEVHR